MLLSPAVAMRKFLWCLASWAAIGGLAMSARAAVVTVGDVPNAPPAGGGAVSGTFTVGEDNYGSVSVTGGDAISSTGRAILGENNAAFGVITLAGFGSDWTINTSSSDLHIGEGGRGTLDVTAAAVVTVPDNTILGVDSTGHGTLNIAGQGSLLLTGDDMFVGSAGIGAVTVADGGTAISDTLIIGDLASGQGIVTVSDVLTQWTVDNVTVGDAGAGRLEIDSAARMFSSGLAVGVTAGSTGVVEVSGVGSLLNVGAVQIGTSGAATLSVSDGARIVTTGAVSVATNAAGMGTIVVSGAGSRLNVTGALNTSAGEGWITVADAGVIVTTAASTISPTGRVTLDGGRWETSAATNAALSVGGLLQGAGVVDVQGVTLTATTATRGRLAAAAGQQLLVTGRVTNNGGLIDLDGGTLETGSLLDNTGQIAARNGAVLRIGATGLENNSTAQLAVTSGTVDVFGDVSNNAGAEIVVAGGGVGVFHDAVDNAGTIFVSSSSEIVLLDDLSFASTSTLALQLGANQAFGLVSVGGTAALSGALEVSLAGNFSAQLGETIEVLRAGDGITGAFASTALPSLGGGLSLDVQYTGDSVMLAVVQGLPGDFDGDGIVNGNDLSVWQSAYGTSGLGDADGDDDSDGSDFLLWQRQFGSAASTRAAAAPVPEPSSVVQLLVLLAAAAIARQRI